MTRVGRIALMTLSVLADSTLHAQRAPTVADVRVRLHSTSPVDVSWAAFDAATFQLRDVAPDLLAVLETPPEADAITSDALVAAVLDALIQLRGTARFRARVPVPPPATLDRYHARWPVQTLILMSAAAAPERGEVLERWFGSTRSGLEWYAIANLLLKESAPPRGFAAHVLTGVKLTLAISVTDGSIPAGIGSGVGFGAGVADGIGQNPRGFPPHAVYDFESARTPGSILLSTGPKDAFYSRRVTNDFQFGVATLLVATPSVDTRLDYLNAIVARRDRFALQEHTSVEIKWRDERALRAEIARNQKKIADEYDRMLRVLMNLGYLTADEANSVPLMLNTDIHDLRPHN